MLARQLPGVAVLVASDRYLAAASPNISSAPRCTCSMMAFSTAARSRPRSGDRRPRGPGSAAGRCPSGRLREPLDTLVAADAILGRRSTAVRMPPTIRAPLFRLRASRRASRTDAAGSAGCPCSRSRNRRPGAISSATSAPPAGVVRDPGVPRSSSVLDGTTSSGSVRGVDGAGAARRHDEKDFVRLLPFRPFRCRSMCRAAYDGHRAVAEIGAG